MTDHGTQLAETARAIVAPGKGVLAADESSPTIKNRFDTINVESTEDNRRSYRELLFTTEGANEFIGGVILFDETLRQSTADGVPLTRILTDAGIVPGIKVDMGAKALAGATGEKVTEGLERATRAARGVPRARRPLYQVAGGDHDRRRHFHPTTASRPTPGRWAATPRCRWSRASCRSSSPRC